MTKPDGGPGIRYKQIFSHDEIVRLYSDEKLSIRMVAGRMGCSLQRVQKILVKRDIPRRPKHVTRHAANYTGAVAQREKDNDHKDLGC